MFATVIDGVIIVLLVAVLALGAWLHHNLQRLRQDDGELNRLIQALGTATSRAEAALDGLRQMVETNRAQLASERERAQEIADDLRFLTDRGRQQADRIADHIERTRTAASTNGKITPAPAPSVKRRQTPAELEQALRTLR